MSLFLVAVVMSCGAIGVFIGVILALFGLALWVGWQDHNRVNALDNFCGQVQRERQQRVAMVSVPPEPPDPDAVTPPAPVSARSK